jgi:hypothetical protein
VNASNDPAAVTLHCRYNWDRDGTPEVEIIDDGNGEIHSEIHTGFIHNELLQSVLQVALASIPDDYEFYVTVSRKRSEDRGRSVLQPWVERLGLRHQGVLMACVRGCDSVPKEDPTKALARCFRATILRSFDPKPTSFIEHVSEKELCHRMRAVLTNRDHYPIHFIMHLMHGSEIVGYKWPDPAAVFWRVFYIKLTQCFHLNIETEDQLDARLGACEAKFAAHAATAYQPTPTETLQ